MPEKMKKLGKNYIKPVEVESGDILQIIRKPELKIINKDDPKKQRERYEVELKGVKTFNLNQKWRLATLNTSSSDELIDSFGDNPDNWVNEMVTVEKKLENVMGEQKEVLYFRPYHNPQTKLPKQEPANNSSIGGVPVNLTPEEVEAIEEMRRRKN